MYEFEPDIKCQEVSVQERDEILYNAVSILRLEMTTITQSSEFYPSPSEVNLENSASFVPPLLARTLMLLIDNRAYESADPDYVPTQKVKRRCLNLAEP